MTIKEVEQELGIPRASIRFYEKERLIEPKREENGYREYDEKDVATLRKVIIFRKLGLPIHAAAWEALPGPDAPLEPLRIPPEAEPREDVPRRPESPNRRSAG